MHIFILQDIYIYTPELPAIFVGSFPKKLKKRIGHIFSDWAKLAIDEYVFNTFYIAWLLHCRRRTFPPGGWGWTNIENLKHVHL